MKPLQQFSFFITRGAPTANGLAEFTAVGNSCHKDCPGVRVSWYCSSLPWSHRNPSPSDAAVSQKKLSTSNGTLRTVGLSPKKKPEAPGPRLPNPEIPAQVLIPNFQILGSPSIKLMENREMGPVRFRSNDWGRSLRAWTLKLGCVAKWLKWTDYFRKIFFFYFPF